MRNITLEETVNECPVCGSEKYVIKSHHEIWIECKRCGLKGPKAEKLQQAIRKWNRVNDR
jgi:transcription elongation factor Elf1